MIRKVCYVSGTRADFGLMAHTLREVSLRSDVSLGVVATGMHLSDRFGRTESQIEAAGLPIVARVPVTLEPATGLTMARALGAMVSGFAEAFDRIQPQIVLLLGDRGEMLAGAIAAVHLNIVVAHVHGGERSGTVDEPVRHAVSKLAHYHFVATEESRHRLVRMGEHSDRIHVVGAPGLDQLRLSPPVSRETLFRALNLDPSRSTALLIHHPVVQQPGEGGKEVQAIIAALRSRSLQVLAVRPNSDAGSDAIWHALDELASDPSIRIVTSLSRADFIGWMSHVEVMVGNSSAGIIEAASLGTPVVNVGTRQNLRERNPNVIDSLPDESAIVAALDLAAQRGRYSMQNVYGDGRSAARISGLLASIPLGENVLTKCNAY